MTDWNTVNDAGVGSFGANEWPLSGAFDRTAARDGDRSGFMTADPVKGTVDLFDSTLDMLIYLPCYIHLISWGVEVPVDTVSTNQVPSKMEVYGSTNGTTFTQVGSYDGVTTWSLGQTRTFNTTDSTLGPFKVFKFTVRRISGTTEHAAAIGDFILYSNISANTDECATGTHNCHSLAACTDSHGSFSCSCNTGFEGDGVTACGIRIPPADIGRGDNLGFQWAKDPNLLFNGFMTFHRNYSGSVCPGVYRVYSSNDWAGNAGDTGVTNEFLPSALFDRSTEGRPWVTGATNVAGLSSGFESNYQLLLELPCVVEMNAYTWTSRSDGYEYQNPSAVTVDAANGTGSGWTELDRFDGVSTWTLGETKTFAANATDAGVFKYFRFTIRRNSFTTTHYASGHNTFLYANSWTDVDECSWGLHNCHGNATCNDTLGSFTCACNTGFVGDGVENCTSAPNECQLGTHNCAFNASCSDTDTSFLCHCIAGYLGDGVNCTAPRPPYSIQLSVWMDSAPGSGLNGRGGLLFGPYDGNTTAALGCGVTHGNWGVGTDGPEAARFWPSGGEIHKAVEVPDGDEWDRWYTLRMDVDVNKNVTPTFANSFSRDAARNASWTYIDPFPESWCNPDSGRMALVGVTLQTKGSNQASFRFQDFVITYNEFDECSNGTHTCNTTIANCTDTSLSFYCKCHDGYTRQGGRCIDASNCNDPSLHNCHSGAACTEVFGSFTCSCNAGYTDSGVALGLPAGLNCTDVDECANSTHDCQDSCSNTIGSFVCSCPSDGYFGSSAGPSCLDVDECQIGIDTCDLFVGSCLNTPGSFDCACNTGYALNTDNRTCAANTALSCGSPVVLSDTAVSAVALPTDECGFRPSDPGSVFRVWVPSPAPLSNQDRPNRTLTIVPSAALCGSTGVEVALSMEVGLFNGTPSSNMTCVSTASGCSSLVLPFPAHFSDLDGSSGALGNWTEEGRGAFFSIRLTTPTGIVGSSVEAQVSLSCSCTSPREVESDTCVEYECQRLLFPCGFRFDPLTGNLTETAVCTDSPTSFSCECNYGFSDRFDNGVFCEAALCDNQLSPVLENGELLWRANIETATTLAEVTFACDAGFELDTGGSGSAFACEGSAPARSGWPALTTLQCNPTVCGGTTPVAPAGGVMTPSSPPDGVSWKALDSVTFTCNDGYLQTGVSTLQCVGVVGASPAASEWEALSYDCIRTSVSEVVTAVCEGDAPFAPLGDGWMVPSGPSDGFVWRCDEGVSNYCPEGNALSGDASRSCVAIPGSARAQWLPLISGEPLCTDNLAPYLNCPSEVHVTMESTWPTARLTELPASIEYRDARLSSVTVTPSLPMSFGDDGREVTVKAADEDGNESTCSFDAIADGESYEEAPTVFCPLSVQKNQVRDLMTVVEFSGPAFVNDNVDSEDDIAITYNPQSGTAFGTGRYQVQLTATDKSGNSASCTFSVIIVDCVGGSWRETENGPCVCKEGFWQDLRGYPRGPGIFYNRFQMAPACIQCPDNALSVSDSRHPSACFCKEGFYAVPDMLGRDPHSVYDESQSGFGLFGDPQTEEGKTFAFEAFRLGKCLPCPSHTVCPERPLNPSLLNGSRRLLDSSPSEKAKQIEANAEKDPLEDRIFDLKMHSRPLARPEFVVAEAAPEAVVVACPISGACLDSGETGSVHCARGMRGPVCSQCERGYYVRESGRLCERCPPFQQSVWSLILGFLGLQALVLFYSYINVPPADGNEKTHIVAIRIVVNYQSLLALVGVIETWRLILPPKWHFLWSLIPRIPWPIHMVEASCTTGPILTALGWDEDDIFFLVILLDMFKVAASALFLFLLGPTLVFAVNARYGIAYLRAKQQQKTGEVRGHTTEGSEQSDEISNDHDIVSPTHQALQEAESGSCSFVRLPTSKSQSFARDKAPVTRLISIDDDSSSSLNENRKRGRSKSEKGSGKGEEEEEEDENTETTLEMRHVEMITQNESEQLWRDMWRRQANKRILGTWRYRVPPTHSPPSPHTKLDSRTPLQREDSATKWTLKILAAVCQDTLTVWIVLYFLTFESVIENLILLVRCDSLAQDLPKRVASAPSVRCNSEIYAFWRPFVVTAIIAFGLLIPLLLGTAILLGARHVAPLGSRPKRMEYRRRYGSLIQGFRPAFFWWEILIIVRKLLLQVAGAFYPGTDTRIRMSQMFIIGLASLLLQLRLEPFNSQDANVLNSLEAGALSVWLLSVLALQASILSALRPSQNAMLLTAIVVANAVYLVWALRVIAKGWLIEFFFTLRALEEGSDPSSLIEDWATREIVVRFFPLLRLFFLRPFFWIYNQKLQQRAVGLKCLDREEKSSEDCLDEGKIKGGVLKEVQTAAFEVVNQGTLDGLPRPIDAEDIRETQRRLGEIFDAAGFWFMQTTSPSPSRNSTETGGVNRRRRSSVGKGVGRRRSSLGEQMLACDGLGGGKRTLTLTDRGGGKRSSSFKPTGNLRGSESVRGLLEASQSFQGRQKSRVEVLDFPGDVEAFSDPKKMCTHFQEFLLRWAFVCCSRLEEDGDLRASAEEGIDFVELLRTAQKMLRPAVSAEDHPYAAFVGSKSQKEEEEEGTVGDASREDAPTSPILSPRSEESPRPLHTENKAHDNSTHLRRNAFRMAGTEWVPLEGSHGDGSGAWGGASQRSPSVFSRSRRTSESFNSSFVSAPTRDLTKTSRQIISLRDLSSRRRGKKGPVSGLGKEALSSRKSKSKTASLMKGWETATEIPSGKTHISRSRVFGFTLPEEVASSGFPFDAQILRRVGTAFFEEDPADASSSSSSSSSSSASSDREGKEEERQDSNTASLKEHRGLKKGNMGRRERGKSTAVQKKRKRKKKKRNQPLVTFNPNPELLQRRVTVDDVVNALWVFLKMHPAVAVWHYFAFLAAKKHRESRDSLQGWLSHLLSHSFTNRPTETEGFEDFDPSRNTKVIIGRRGHKKVTDPRLLFETSILLGTNSKEEEDQPLPERVIKVQKKVVGQEDPNGEDEETFEVFEYAYVEVPLVDALGSRQTVPRVRSEGMRVSESCPRKRGRGRGRGVFLGGFPCVRVWLPLSDGGELVSASSSRNCSSSSDSSEDDFLSSFLSDELHRQRTGRSTVRRLIRSDDQQDELIQGTRKSPPSRGETMRRQMSSKNPLMEMSLRGGVDLLDMSMRRFSDHRSNRKEQTRTLTSRVESESLSLTSNPSDGKTKERESPTQTAPPKKKKTTTFAQSPTNLTSLMRSLKSLVSLADGLKDEDEEESSDNERSRPNSTRQEEIVASGSSDQQEDPLTRSKRGQPVEIPVSSRVGAGGVGGVTRAPVAQSKSKDGSSGRGGAEKVMEEEEEDKEDEIDELSPLSPGPHVNSRALLSLNAIFREGSSQKE
uniref:Uncharacterized protein n=1 Tax=Chromera velia CCMP2878 TaxID=1169474 RepID=A0A0G4IE73_9ALVE|eukprot:Cvel_13509.t1-p1 / transcript=Cvel_13509.t1 / gene=Cvel_13509 / organism=Chromera_velia_CCMP2878 / gene_product=Fibrillin-1, putative / transcript_product=Fibrillin-1, putative / location=Cvel_scaffold926:27306-45418(-) / protein_length=3355 / sequence_SO=supercontig / SO=protein_coding / is_pseudo=false